MMSYSHAKGQEMYAKEALLEEYSSHEGDSLL